MIETPKCLNLRVDIFCPECLGRYRLDNSWNYSGMVSLIHPVNLNVCRRMTVEGLTKHMWKDTQYIEAKPLGEGIAVVQLPNSPVFCYECQQPYIQYTLETLRVIYSHASHQLSKCKSTRAIPLGQLTIFI